MSAPVAIARLGRAGAAVLCAEAGPGGLAVKALERSKTPGLTPQGHPSPAAGALIASLCREAGAEAVTLVLPGGATALKRAEVDLPDPSPVTNALIEKAVAKAQDALAKDGEAFLACRPYAYVADGAPRAEPPLGERVRLLTVETAAATASVALLAAFDRAVRERGISLTGVIAAPDAIAAALLPDGEGAFVRVAREDTLAAAVMGGVVYAQARVPLGRRHLESDLAQAHALEPAEAARRTDAVLAGTSSNDDAIRVVGKRLEEIADLLMADAERAGVPLDVPVLSGLPPAAAAKVAGARVADLSALAPALRDEPSLAGGAFLTLGLRGGLDRPSLPERKKPSPLDWLLKRF